MNNLFKRSTILATVIFLISNTFPFLVHVSTNETLPNQVNITPSSLFTSKNTSAYRNKFAKTLLVINFNHAFYDNIEFIEQLYSPFFEHIVFFGEQAHPKVHQIVSQNGFLHCPMVKKALELYPNYEGYLFLEDDCILNIWNCLNLDLTKIWLPANNGRIHELYEQVSFFNANIQTGENAKVWWWQSALGFEPSKKAYNQLLPHYTAMLTKNIGAYNIPATLCDMFYIPKKFRLDAMVLSEAFKDIFVEIAIPFMMCCLDDLSNWQPCSMLWGIYQPEHHEWPMQFTCIHPVKISNPSNKTLITNVYERGLSA